MRSIVVHGATLAPSISPEFLQLSRISARVGVSRPVAGLLAELAFGAARRGDLVALAAVTANRTTACGEASR